MSQVVVHNKIVYLSGQIDGSAEDITGQTQNVLAKVDQYLTEAGTDKSKLLTSTIWLQDITRDFGAMNEVWNAWIDPKNKPVRATTEASLASPKYLVEIQVTASLEWINARVCWVILVYALLFVDEWFDGIVNAH